MKLKTALGAFNALVVVMGLGAGGISTTGLLVCMPWVLTAVCFLAKPTRPMRLAAALANGVMVLAGCYYTYVAIEYESPSVVSIALGVFFLPALNLVALWFAAKGERQAAGAAV